MPSESYFNRWYSYDKFESLNNIDDSSKKLLIHLHSRNLLTFDDIAELALIFCLTNNDLLNVIKKVCDLYPSEIVFSDVAGIKELQFRTTINSIDVLNRYYEAN